MEKIQDAFRETIRILNSIDENFNPKSYYSAVKFSERAKKCYDELHEIWEGLKNEKQNESKKDIEYLENEIYQQSQKIG